MPRSTPPSTSPAPVTHSSTPRPATHSPAHAASTSPSRTTGGVPPARAAEARADIAGLTRYLGAGGVSIEVRDATSGATFRYGADGGMLSASSAKLYILEVLLWQHHGKALDPTERALATRMIENSDNAAADALYVRIGEGRALRAAAAALGVQHTVPGPGIYWGFNRSAAADYIALLRNLTRAGPLSPSARDFALDLLGEVEPDQRWGVSAAADAGTHTRQKNGWLAASPDDFRWVVNSVGIITKHGHTVFVAVLTQHGGAFSTGVELVEKLARISVGVVARS